MAKYDCFTLFKCECGNVESTAEVKEYPDCTLPPDYYPVRECGICKRRVQGHTILRPAFEKDKVEKCCRTCQFMISSIYDDTVKECLLQNNAGNTGLMMVANGYSCRMWVERE